VIDRARRMLAALTLLALSAGSAARAADQPPAHSELTIDVDVVSIGVTWATRIGERGVLLGAGGGVGLSPYLGATFATGTHYDPAPSTTPVLEFAHAELFARFELASWLHADTGVRAGLFIHGGENLGGGQFAALFVMPALVWRWLSLGPRISAGLLTESQGPTEGVLTLDYMMLRFVISW
jgi:hypothetical protein